ncbi:cytochrome c family protein [Myxococcota bacterium]|nr:cytochrome c family protein [Myxococcota bacterium]
MTPSARPSKAAPPRSAPDGPAPWPWVLVVEAVVVGAVLSSRTSPVGKLLMLVLFHAPWLGWPIWVAAARRVGLSARATGAAVLLQGLAAVAAALLVSGVLACLLRWPAPESGARATLALLHLLAGLTLALPLALYLGPHVRATWTPGRLLHVVAGGTAAVAALLCVATGMLLVDALPARVAPSPEHAALARSLWRFPRAPLLVVHVAASAAAVSVAAAHVVRAVRTGRRFPALAAAPLRLFGSGPRAGAAAGIALALAAVAWGASLDAAPPPPATPRSGGPLPAALARPAEGCAFAGGCHAVAVEQWRTSPHARSGVSPFLEDARSLRVAEAGTEGGRTCHTCHAPLARLGPAPEGVADPRVARGVDCLGCHSLHPGPEAADGDYALAPPRPYPFEGSPEEGLRATLRYLAVAVAPERHAADLGGPRLREAALCASCHQQHTGIDGAVRGQDAPASLAAGPGAGAGCVGCHMPVVETRDLLAVDGRMHHHGLVAAEPDLGALLQGGQDAEPGMLPGRARLSWAGEGPGAAGSRELHFEVEATGTGHAFPGGTLDQARLDLVVRDARGAEVGRSRVAGVRLVDASGAPLLRHQTWRAARAIPTGAAPEGPLLPARPVRVRVAVPASSSPQTATLLYSARPAALWTAVVGEGAPAEVEVASVAVPPAAPSPASPGG